MVAYRENQMAGLQRGFENVDKNPDQIAFFKFLDLAANQQSVLESRERVVELCPVESGDHVLDVGCGLGYEARRLSQLVGDGGRVVVLDVSAAFVEEARKRSRDMPEVPEFLTGDAVDLKFEDGIFDVCRSERVLLYVSDPAQAITEMARVTKPAGKVIVHNFDHDGFFIDSNLPVLTRKIESLMRRAPKNPSLLIA